MGENEGAAEPYHDWVWFRHDQSCVHQDILEKKLSSLKSNFYDFQKKEKSSTKGVEILLNHLL